MARIIFFLIGILVAQNVNCAPSETIDKTLESEHDEPTFNDKPYSMFENSENVYHVKSQVQRQKRTFPAISYNYLAPYYAALAKVRLHLQKLQEKLQNKVNLPYPLLPPSVYSMFVPNPISQVSSSHNPVTSDETTTQSNEPTNVSVPTLHDRRPEIEKEGQNLGLVINNTTPDYDDGDDDNEGHTPLIVFESSQADINDPVTPPTTTVNPLLDVPSAHTLGDN